MERLETLGSLDQVLPYRLILVMTCQDCGSADRLGALLDDWSATGTIRSARLTLEEAHNSPERFLEYLQAALQSSEGMPDRSHRCCLEDCLIDLLNSTLNVEQELILWLDNYHVIHDAEVQALVSLLLDYLPPRMHLILTCCEPPPLPIPRMRVRSQMAELSI